MADRNSSAPVGVQGSEAVDPATFGSVLGQAVWLMTMSKAHRDLPVSWIDQHLLPALLLKQFRMFLKGQQPVAFVTWGMLSEAAAAKAGAGAPLELADWRSGHTLSVVNCISPFAEADKVKTEFLESMKART